MLSILRQGDRFQDGWVGKRQDDVDHGKISAKQEDLCSGEIVGEVSQKSTERRESPWSSKDCTQNSLGDTMGNNPGW